MLRLHAVFAEAGRDALPRVQADRQVGPTERPAESSGTGRTLWIRMKQGFAVGQIISSPHRGQGGSSSAPAGRGQRKTLVATLQVVLVALRQARPRGADGMGPFWTTVAPLYAALLVAARRVPPHVESVLFF